MCGRFTLTITPEELAAILALVDLEPFPPRYNIAPTQPILMVMSAESAPRPGSNLPDRRSLLVRWGLIPRWAKDPRSLPLMINIRSETYADPNGSEIDTGAILTTAASPDIAPIHDRMPVVVRPEDRDRWLDCRTNEPADVADILRPPGPGVFEAIPVSDLVNKVSNTGPEVQRPVAPPSSAPTAEPPPSPADQLKLL